MRRAADLSNRPGMIPTERFSLIGNNTDFCVSKPGSCPAAKHPQLRVLIPAPRSLLARAAEVIEQAKIPPPCCTASALRAGCYGATRVSLGKICAITASPRDSTDPTERAPPFPFPSCRDTPLGPAARITLDSGHFRPPNSFGEETWCATEKLPTAPSQPLGNWTS
jgi:hypothetical protein